jgi:hypothetical protein
MQKQSSPNQSSHQSSRSQASEQHEEPLGNEPHQLESLARDEWPDDVPTKSDPDALTGEATGENNPQQMRTSTTWSEEPELDQAMTWRPATAHGVNSDYELTVVPTSAFAFPRQRALPLLNSDDVETAIQEFQQVAEVTDWDREQAFNNIRAAAEHYSITLPARSWQELVR